MIGKLNALILIAFTSAAKGRRRIRLTEKLLRLTRQADESTRDVYFPSGSDLFLYTDHLKNLDAETKRVLYPLGREFFDLCGYDGSDFSKSPHDRALRAQLLGEG